MQATTRKGCSAHTNEAHLFLLLAPVLLVCVRACVFVQHGGVRLASVQSILGIVSSGDSVLVEKANSFLERFSRRVQEMTSDADPEVAAAAVELLAQFLDAGRLSETEGDNVPPLMWDENAHIREGAVSFVMADTYSADSVDVQPEDDVTQLLNLFDKYCPRPEEQQQDSGQHTNNNMQASRERRRERGGGETMSLRSSLNRSLCLFSSFCAPLQTLVAAPCCAAVSTFTALRRSSARWTRSLWASGRAFPPFAITAC